MGGEVFNVEYSAETAREAFNNAVEDARYSHGNDGYTGTIAEKEGFVVIASPIDDVGAFISAVEGYTEGSGCEIDDKHEAVVKKAFEVYDSKWGPALCVPLKKKAHNGNNMYLFCGWASS